MPVAIVLVLVLSACSVGQKRETAGSALLSQVRARLAGDSQSPAAPPELTRETVVTSGLATVRARTDQLGTVTLVAKAKNDVYVSYFSPSRQVLTFRGSALTATRNFGYDLLAVRHAQNDPLVTGGAPQDWPRQVFRQYVLVSDSPEGNRIDVMCRLSMQPEMPVTILGQAFITVPVLEKCSNDDLAFTNAYWADAKTGFVWKARYWTGPEVPALEVEVLEPFTE
jgi:group 4 capsule polysaccharide lipoprotein GfcB/YjbF